MGKLWLPWEPLVCKGLHRKHLLKKPNEFGLDYEEWHKITSRGEELNLSFVIGAK